jgi:hypothetical protein
MRKKITNKYKALLQKVQREAHAKRKRMQSNEKTNLLETVPETPRGKAYSDLIQAGVTPEKVPSIRRKLTNAYALLGEIKTASEQRRGKTKARNREGVKQKHNLKL